MLSLEIMFKVPSGADRLGVVGSSERNLKIIREALGVRVAARDRQISLSGEQDAVFVARRVLEELSDAAVREEPLSRQ